MKAITYTGWRWELNKPGRMMLDNISLDLSAVWLHHGHSLAWKYSLPGNIRPCAKVIFITAIYLSLLAPPVTPFEHNAMIRLIRWQIKENQMFGYKLAQTIFFLFMKHRIEMYYFLTC